MSLVKILLLIESYAVASKGAVTFVNFMQYTGKKSPLTIVSSVAMSTALTGVPFKQLSAGQTQRIPVTNLVP